MREMDPGHVYELSYVDRPESGYLYAPNPLVFVKREGEAYPGNEGHHAGATTQEVLRACIARMKYVDGQIPCEENGEVIAHLRLAIELLEHRAFRRKQQKVNGQLAQHLSGAFPDHPPFSTHWRTADRSYPIEDYPLGPDGHVDAVALELLP